jgi:hypothetical protein
MAQLSISRPSLVPVSEVPGLKLTRLEDPGLQSDGLRFETSLGRIVLLSGQDVLALCSELPKLFPEYFEGG